MLFDTLIYISDKINKKNLTWALGASLVLYFHGLVDSPKDIDLLVSLEDVEQLDGLLCELGEKKYREKVELYSTERFIEYSINSVDLDLMAGLTIAHSEGLFRYPFDTASITEFRTVNGVKLPLTSLEDWYVLYQLIPNREHKVLLIEEYLIKNGIKHRDLLKRALERELPAHIRERTERLLKAIN